MLKTCFKHLFKKKILNKTTWREAGAQSSEED